jgi:hypothetical protein
MDFYSGLAEIEAETYDEPPPRNKMEAFWQWLVSDEMEAFCMGPLIASIDVRERYLSCIVTLNCLSHVPRKKTRHIYPSLFDTCVYHGRGVFLFIYLDSIPVRLGYRTLHSTLSLSRIMNLIAVERRWFLRYALPWLIPGYRVMFSALPSTLK